MALKVVDRAMQAYGGAGVSQDTPLAQMWASGRTMRIVDGPDEVHMLQLGRNENKRGDALRKRILAQQENDHDERDCTLSEEVYCFVVSMQEVVKEYCVIDTGHSSQPRRGPTWKWS